MALNLNICCSGCRICVIPSISGKQSCFACRISIFKAFFGNSSCKDLLREKQESSGAPESFGAPHEPGFVKIL